MELKKEEYYAIIHALKENFNENDTLEQAVKVQEITAEYEDSCWGSIPLTIYFDKLPNENEVEISIVPNDDFEIYNNQLPLNTTIKEFCSMLSCNDIDCIIENFKTLMDENNNEELIADLTDVTKGLENLAGRLGKRESGDDFIHHEDDRVIVNYAIDFMKCLHDIIKTMGD